MQKRHNTIESNFVNKINKFLDSPAEIQLSSTVTTFRFHLTNAVMDWQYYTSSRLELKQCGTYNTVHLFRVISSQPDAIQRYSNTKPNLIYNWIKNINAKIWNIFMNRGFYRVENNSFRSICYTIWCWIVVGTRKRFYCIL